MMTEHQAAKSVDGCAKISNEEEEEEEEIFFIAASQEKHHHQKNVHTSTSFILIMYTCR
jgi:hypothetical protein